MKLQNVQFDDIDFSDAPDFSNAFISYAEDENGTPLTEQQLDKISDDETYELLMDYIY